MSINKALFSSERQDWETPQELFDKWNEIYDFELDVCATAENAKCKEYFTPEMDGLSQSWGGKRCWMNPPYGREIGKWMQKAYEESLKGATVVCLVPSRTDTAWWHDYAMHGEHVFIRGRIKFVDAESSAPFPSALVIFRNDDPEAQLIKDRFSACKRCNTRPKLHGKRIDDFRWHVIAQCFCGYSAEGYGFSEIKATDTAVFRWNIGYRKEN